MPMKIEDNVLKIADEGCYVHLRMGKGVQESIVYLPKGAAEIPIPSGEGLEVFPEDAFEEGVDSFFCALATKEKITSYRNLALNPADMPGQSDYFPHASANFVSKNSFRFETRSAIDGFAETNGHYGFPFQAWGGGDRDDLEYCLEFGRPVEVDKLVLYLRADYSKNEEGKEHDTYWKEVTVQFSDGTSMTVHPVKSGDGQCFPFTPRIITDLKLKNLVRDWSFPTRGFAALSQIEVWGRDILKEKE